MTLQSWTLQSATLTLIYHLIRVNSHPEHIITQTRSASLSVNIRCQSSRGLKRLHVVQANITLVHPAQ